MEEGRITEAGLPGAVAPPRCSMVPVKKPIDPRTTGARIDLRRNSCVCSPRGNIRARKGVTRKWHGWRWLQGALLICSQPLLLAQTSKPTALHPPKEQPAKFVDITASSGIRFLHQAPHTSRKYLIETMGSGVALFDCDNDGRLDIFLVNGRSSETQRPRAQSQKTGPAYWNRLYHQRAMAPSKT